MVIETLNALIKSGGDALQTTCALTVTHAHVSLVKHGSLTFPSLAELHIRNGSLQKVHLGCDTHLVGQLAGMAGGTGERSGIEVLTSRFLAQLLEEMEGRNPRGQIENLAVAPLTIQTRGIRTVGFRLETDAGQMFLLAEVPSRAELEHAKGSDFMAGMVSTYMAREWRQRTVLATAGVVDSFLVFLRKTEQDVYFEVADAGGDITLHPGFLLANGSVDDRRALKFCVNLNEADLTAPGRGESVTAHVGVDDRSLGFELAYLGACEHELAGGASLPCGWFAVPETIRVSQRRKAFRLPVQHQVTVELRCIPPDGRSLADGEEPEAMAVGHVADLSFSGVRIVLDREDPESGLEEGQKVICEMQFADEMEVVRVVGVIRRSTFSLADRNRWQEELGIEFVVAGEDDRPALEFIRHYVLSLQRSRLAQRIHVTNSP